MDKQGDVGLEASWNLAQSGTNHWKIGKDIVIKFDGENIYFESKEGQLALTPFQWKDLMNQMPKVEKYIQWGAIGNIQVNENMELILGQSEMLLRCADKSNMKQKLTLLTNDWDSLLAVQGKISQQVELASIRRFGYSIVDIIQYTYLLLLRDQMDENKENMHPFSNLVHAVRHINQFRLTLSVSRVMYALGKPTPADLGDIIDVYFTCKAIDVKQAWQTKIPDHFMIKLKDGLDKLNVTK